MNEAIYRSPEWLRKFADFEIRTGKDLKGNEPESNKKNDNNKRTDSKETKSDWDKRWENMDRYLFIKFYEDVYPDDFRDRYQSCILSSDMKDIHSRYRGNFEIFQKFDLWLSERSDRERRERSDREKAEQRRREDKERQDRIKKKLDNLYDKVIEDFKSAPYQDKAYRPNENGQTCFKYIFEDGSILFLNPKGNSISYRNTTYTLNIIYLHKFVRLANALFESQPWKANKQRPGGRKFRSDSGNNSNDPKSNHPKWGLYQNLKQTVLRREEQLKKMPKDDPERQALENEYRVAKATLDKLKNQYQFEHLKSFEEYLSKEEFETELVKSRGDEVDFIEDLFMEYADKWNMRHGKYISDVSTQPKGFNDENYNLWYTVYESFSPKIARLYVPSDYYVELNIQAHTWKESIDKEKLFTDIDKFLIRLQKYGWKYVESKTQNRRSFLNTNPGIGEYYDNNLRYYFYKD